MIVWVMGRKRRFLFILLAIGLLATAVASAQPVGASAGAQNSNVEVIATGLRNPRGMDFGPDGALYVAQSGRGGRGPCILTSAGAMECLGSNGAILRIEPGSKEQVVSGLPSIAAHELSGDNAIGPSNISFDGNDAYFTTGLAADPALRADLGQKGSHMGKLFRLPTPGGRPAEVADFVPFEATVNPDGGLPDTNPNGVVALPGRQIVADAGGNSVLEVGPNGEISTLAVLPEGMAPAPPFLGLPPGTMIPFQPVPTSVDIGPDGYIYVGQLTGFPFPVGGASVWRIPPNGGTPEVFTSGFTTIMDIEFADDGSLYVLQISTDSLFIAPPSPGALIRVAPDGTRTTVAMEELSFPGGLAIGPDGDLYVSNRGTSASGGQVLRIGAPNG
jgi:hypothetical protein